MLEGDDYWIDTEKLEKQVSALQRDSGCVLSYSRVEYVDGFGTSIPPPARFAHLQEHLGTLTIGRLSNGNVIHTPTVLLRNSNSLRRDFCNQLIRNAPMGDWPLFLLSLREGLAIQHVERLASYRFSETSYWFGVPTERARMFSAATAALLAASRMFDTMLTEHFVRRAMVWYRDNKTRGECETVCSEFDAFLEKTIPFPVVLDLMGRLNSGLGREQQGREVLEARCRGLERTVCHRVRKAAARLRRAAISWMNRKVRLKA